MAEPYVVSLRLDPAAQERFDRLRRELFPRTRVGAHVTLFHALPAHLAPVPSPPRWRRRPAGPGSRCG